MRITRVNISKNYPLENGLDDIRMDHLGQLVLLAGRNGSGKSRLLDKLSQAFVAQPTRDVIHQTNTNIQNHKRNIEVLEDQLRNWGNPEFQANIQGQARENEIDRFKMDMSQSIDFIKKQQIELSKEVLQISNDVGVRKIVHFVPKNLDLRDPKAITEHERENSARNASLLGIQDFHMKCLPKIQELHTQYWHATHQSSELVADQKEEICQEYKRLQSNIFNLLGVQLGNDSRGSATIFGFPIGQSHLSDGQRVLLQLAVAIHCQVAELSEIILLLDEPENHIHPAAIIDVLEKLVDKIPNGQIWIATHSVSLLAHFSDQASLWYLDGGKVSPAGKIQEKVLQGLLGNEARISRQRDFLNKPEQVALMRYAQECLCPPSVVMTGPDDPQVNQIRHAITKLYERFGRINVLDYGAGQGRLLADLAEDCVHETIRDKMDYVAFDQSTQYHEVCKTQIKKIYEVSEDRWFCSYDELLAKRNKGSFHLVVLCNVMHEIPPKTWGTLFGPAGQITELLKEEGYLLIVEDQRIPVGENAHQHGFIVLDTGSLKDLLAVQGADPSVLEDSQREGRLKSHLISKQQLSKVTRETIKKALESHGSHSRREIDRLRGVISSDGRLFAFWLVQYANADMALRDDFRE